MLELRCHGREIRILNFIKIKTLWLDTKLISKMKKIIFAIPLVCLKKGVHILYLWLNDYHFLLSLICLAYSSLFIICKWLVQKDFSIISPSFQKKICWDCYMKKNVAFTLISFAVLKWDDCLSVQVPFELPVQILVQLLLELQTNWLGQNVNYNLNYLKMF